jgi:FeS assembly SUF system protein
MKPLPVVQPPSAGSDRPAGEPLQTAGMVNDEARRSALEPHIVKALSGVFDPEIPVNIYELGLIYEIIVTSESAVGVRMTLTAPGCPAAQLLPEQVRSAVARVEGVTDTKVDVVWEPPWDRDRMSDAAKLQLGLW